MQDWSTSNIIFDIPALVSLFAGSSAPLEGSMIRTGRPQGVGFARQPPVCLKPRDSTTVEIDAIGALTTPVTEDL